jgi:hypothetical protein
MGIVKAVAGLSEPSHEGQRLLGHALYSAQRSPTVSQRIYFLAKGSEAARQRAAPCTAHSQTLAERRQFRCPRPQGL